MELERICNTKGTESKRTERKEKKEARKKFKTGSQKKSKFWLMRMHQIEILSQIFVHLSVWYKLAFSANLKLIQRHGSQKNPGRLPYGTDGDARRKF